MSISRTDRLAGYLLLGLTFALLFVPSLEWDGKTLSFMSPAVAWLCAAGILLFAEAKHIKSARIVAAFLFMLGLAGPFLAILINQSLGA